MPIEVDHSSFSGIRVVLDQIIQAMQAADFEKTTDLAVHYLANEFDGEALLRSLRNTTADKSCGQRALVETWYAFGARPDQRLALIAMARWGAFAHQPRPS